MSSLYLFFDPGGGVGWRRATISVIRPPWNETKTLTGVLLFPTATPKGTRHEVSSQYGPSLGVLRPVSLNIFVRGQSFLRKRAAPGSFYTWSLAVIISAGVILSPTEMPLKSQGVSACEGLAKRSSPTSKAATCFIARSSDPPS